MRNLIFIMLLFQSTLTYSSTTFSLGKFSESGLKQFKGGKFTFPMVLFFNKDGRLYRSIAGKRIYDLSSYKEKLEVRSKTIVLSPSLSKLLDYFSVTKKTSKPTIVYLDIKDVCPPCKPMKNKFDKNIRKNIKDEFELIYLAGVER